MNVGVGGGMHVWVSCDMKRTIGRRAWVCECVGKFKTGMRVVLIVKTISQKVIELMAASMGVLADGCVDKESEVSKQV